MEKETTYALVGPTGEVSYIEVEYDIHTHT